MKLGIPALVEFNKLEQLVLTCTELKLDFIELNMNLPYNFIQNLNPQELKQIKDEHNIDFTIHMPDEADLGSFYGSVRQGYVDLFKDTIDFASEAGIKLLNLHMIEGAKMTLPDRKVYMYDEYSDEYVNNFKNSIEILSEIATKKNIILAIENSANFGKTYIQKALDEAIKYSNVKLCYDIGHDAMSNYTDQPYLLSHQDKIAHMHLHDYTNKKDHQVLFEGELDIKKFLSFASEKNISALIEVKTKQALQKSLTNLKRELTYN